MNIFMISGWQRTGSTLVLRLLDGHPDLYVHPDSGFAFQPDDPLLWPDFTLAKRDRNFNVAFETATTPPLHRFFWDAKIGRRPSGRYDDQPPEFQFDFDHFLKSWRHGVEEAQDWTDELIIGSYVRRYFDNLKSHPQTTGKGYVFSQSRMGFDYKRFRQFFPDGKLILTRRDILTRMVSWMGLGRGPVKPGVLTKLKMPKSLARDLHRLYKQAQQQKFQDVVIEEIKGLDWVFVYEYEDMLSDSESMMRRLANFLEIDFHEILLTPTVYGQPWLSNSTFDRSPEQRGKVDPMRGQRNYWTATDKKLIKLIYRYCSVPPAGAVVSATPHKD